MKQLLQIPSPVLLLYQLLALSCQVSMLQTLINCRLFSHPIHLPLRLLPLLQQRCSQHYRNLFLRPLPKQQLFVPSPVPRNPTLTVPVNHILPNLSAWTFLSLTSNLPTQVSTVLLPNQRYQVTTTSTLLGSTPVPSTPVMPVTCSGTIYYVPPPVNTTSAVVGALTQPTSLLPSAIAASFVPPPVTTVPPTSSTCFTLPEVAQPLAPTKKDHLPQWKLSWYNGNPVQWHEWFGLFKSAIDSSSLSDDVNLTYLKTLVAEKAKIAIAEFAYCEAMYKDALKTLERKFGQSQAVVTAYLDKLATIPPVKMHNSDSIISYSATVSSLVGVFRYLNYNQNLSSASLLGQAVQKLPPNMKEA